MQIELFSIKKLSMSKRIQLAIMMLVVSTVQVLAMGPTFYYQFIARPAATAEGRVYVSNEDETPTDDQYLDLYGTSVLEEKPGVNVQASTVTAFLYAKAEPGYMFTHWTRVNGNSETAFSNLKNATDLVTTTSQDIQNPKVTNYKAYFAKIGLVYPVSSDESLGAITIDIPTNKLGDQVTLTAIPDMFNGVFKGWRRNSSAVLIEENPLKLNVTNATKGTYTAVFEAKGIDEKGLYVMLENLGTNSMLGVRGNSESTLSSDQRYFKESLMLVPTSNEHIHTMPSLVLKMKGASTGTGGLKNVEMIGQGISTYTIGNLRFRVERYLENDCFVFGNINGFTGYIKDNGGASQELEMVGTIHYPSVYNRPDANKRYRWKFHIIDEEHLNENYFGAQPSSGTKQDGKYYTTMYTAFPYQCLDGVKAYIIDKYLDNGKAHLRELTQDIVPANTAVILECNSTQAIGNRLMPLLTTPDAISTNNFLKGEMYLNDESGNEANYRTAFNAGTMRVLSADKAVFTNTNLVNPSTNNELQYIANNTCYLDVSELGDNAPAEIQFTKDDDASQLLGDVNGDREVNVVDVMTLVRYILGESLNVFIEGNADPSGDGEINIIDAMWIINYVLSNS